MPANWGLFSASVIPFLKSGTSPDEQTTAQFIAKAYLAAISTAAQSIYQNLVIPTSVNTSAIEQGLTVSLKTAKLLTTPSTPATWLPAASGFVGAWVSAQFNPLPPHLPAIAPATGLKLLFPGEPNTIAAGLFGAFSSMDTILTVNIMITTFTAHLASITGIYNGLMTNPALIPPTIPTPPIPWVGII